MEVNVMSVLMGIFYVFFAVLMTAFFIGLGLYIKEIKKYKAKVLLRDSKDFTKYFVAKITGQKGNDQVKEVTLIPSKSPIQLLKRRKICFNKPDDQYITRTDRGEYFIEGYYVNGTFSPIGMDQEGKNILLAEARKREKINDWALVKQIQQDNRRKGNNVMFWTTIGLVILGIIMIVGMIFIANMVSETTTSMNENNKALLEQWDKANTQLLNIIGNRQTTTGSPPDLSP